MKKSLTDINVLLLAGSWDDFGGSESSYMDKFYRSMLVYLKKDQIDYHNGGLLNDLRAIVSNATSYDLILSYANYDFGRYGHLKFREYHKGSIITTFRKESHFTLDNMRSYILNSKSDFMIELGDDGYISEYVTRLLNSNGVVISTYTSDLLGTIGRLLNESIHKINSKKIRIFSDLHYGLYPSDIALMENVSVILKNLMRGQLFRSFSLRIPERYIMTQGKRINLNSRVLITSRNWNSHSNIYDQNVVPIYYDEKNGYLRYSGSSSTPSVEAYIHKMLYELSDDFDYIIRTDNYYKEAIFTSRIPVVNTYDLSSLVAQTYLVSKSSIISVPGQGSFIFISNLFDPPKMTLTSGPSEVIPSYVEPDVGDTNLSIDSHLVSHEDTLEKYNSNGTYSIVDQSDIIDTDRVRIM